MTQDEAIENSAELRRRIRLLRPDDCPYCGGFHKIRVTRMGRPEPENYCCPDMMREVLRLEREIFGSLY